MPDVPVKLYLDRLLKQSRECSKAVSLLPGPVKAQALHAMAERLMQDEEALLAANEEDVEAVGKSLAGETSRERVRERRFARLLEPCRE